MAKVSLRVRHDRGQGVVRGLDPLDSVERLVSHSMEVLGLEQVDLDRIKMLSGEVPLLHALHGYPGVTQQRAVSECSRTS